LDENLRKSTESFKFSRFFNKILVRIETIGAMSTIPLFSTYSWSRDTSSNSAQPEVDGITFKIPGDQVTACRVFLFRRGTDRSKGKAHKFRYCEVSSKLRDMLPQLRADPSEEDVLLAVWQYVTHRDLFGDKDHKFIKCDEKLKSLFQTDSVFVAHLRGKLASHLLAEKPVVVDQQLDPANLSQPADKPFSAAAFSRNGAGRVVDLEVDLAETDLPHPAGLPADLQLRRRRLALRAGKLQGRLALILRSLQRRVDQALLTQQAATGTTPAHSPSSLVRGPSAGYTPLSVFESIVNRGPPESALVGEAGQQRRKRLRGDGAAPELSPHWPLLQHLLAPAHAAHAAKRIHSGLHVFGGFLDVGESSVFAADADWLQRHVAELATEHRPQPPLAEAS